MRHSLRSHQHFSPGNITQAECASGDANAVTGNDNAKKLNFLPLNSPWLKPIWVRTRLSCVQMEILMSF